MTTASTAWKLEPLEKTFGARVTAVRLAEIDGLTKRELDVIRLICRALSGNEIARELQMSEKTVRNHTSNIYAKLDVQNRQQAIREYGHLF